MMRSKVELHPGLDPLPLLITCFRLQWFTRRIMEGGQGFSQSHGKHGSPQGLVDAPC